jgi:hypothetical protein
MSEAGQRRLHVEALSEIGSLSEVTIGIIEFMGIVTGPIRRDDGIVPAVALVDPKFPHNVGAAVRAASCYGVRQVWFSGDRVRLDGAKRQRLPREERMRGYKEVEVRHADQFFDAFEVAVPVAVENRMAAVLLVHYWRPSARCPNRWSAAYTPVYPHDCDQVLFDLLQHSVRADAQPAVGTADERSRGAGPSAKASTARLTAIISAWSAMKRTKVACAISDQMILTGCRRTAQP